MAQPTFTLTAGAGLAARIGTTRESLAGAKLTLKSNIRKGDGVVIDGGIEYIQDVVLTLDEDGKINGDTGVALLADDVSLGLENTLQWQVNIKNAKAQGFATSVSSWWIDAGADGATVSLDTQPKAVGQTAYGARGPRGYGFGGLSLVVENTVQSLNELGAPVGEPVELTVLTIEGIDGGTPGDSGEYTIDGGTP